MPWRALARPSRAVPLVAAALVAAALLALPAQPPAPEEEGRHRQLPGDCSWFRRQGPPRAVTASITEFGGVGDGRTSNTGAFRRAVERLGELAGGGGARLNVPRGRWLTGNFNLTSNFTLFLEEGAVILGSQDPKDWPLIEPLPSYGRGRERPGSRHISLIHGNGLSDVEIRGENGSIDGQGRYWWELWWSRKLEHTRGSLLELVNSNDILISNLTFLNSPFWTIHPVYCSNVVAMNVTVLAPLHSPNTDGIDPDSSSNVCIQDCYIESGDDLIAIKSGWDQYGLAAARPSSNIVVRRVSGTTPTCSGVGIGSEMSGGVSGVLVESLRLRDCANGVKLKTDRGRGGYVANVTVSGVDMERVRTPVSFSVGAGDHPDGGWDPEAMPKVDGLVFRDIVGRRIGRAPVLEGMAGSEYAGVCFSNVSLEVVGDRKEWRCEHVNGGARDVFPSPCKELISSTNSSSSCGF